MEWHINPRNPGEVFACAGLAHLAWRRDQESKTGFSFEDRCRFVAPDLAKSLDDLTGASIDEADDGLRFAGIDLDWWREWGLNPGLKTWAGRQSASTVHNNLLRAAAGSRATDWLAHVATTTGRLNVDALGSWNALGMGWSLNEHKHTKMVCRPWVELLASIGLQAFPVRGSKSNEEFSYNLWRPVSLPGAVAAFGAREPSIYAEHRYRTRTGRSGSNMMLCIASPA